MKRSLLAVLALVLVPLAANAQRGGGGGFGGGGMGQPQFGGGPRFEAPELPGPELDGPLDSTGVQKVLTLNDDQAKRYVTAYTAFMAETKSARDSIKEQIGTMEEKLSAGDRAAALFYAERATKVSKGLKDRQTKWEEGTAYKIFTSDQVKAYKKWKKDQEDLAEERRKKDVMRWNPMGGDMASGRIEDKVSISAPVGSPSGTAAAVRVGRTVYVAGQVSLDADGNLVGEGDLRAQAVKAFANLSAVLLAARARPFDVVRLTVYIVNYKPQDMAMIREVGAAYLPQGNPPALTVVGVQALYREGLLISVEATALVGVGGTGRVPPQRGE